MATSRSFGTLIWFRVVLFVAIALYTTRIFLLHQSNDGNNKNGGDAFLASVGLWHEVPASDLPTVRQHHHPKSKMLNLSSSPSSLRINSSSSSAVTTNSSSSTIAGNATISIFQNDDNTSTSPLNGHPFYRYDGVVIVTKVHGKHQLKLLEQSLCLLHHAYNHRMAYDIVVFSTEFIPPSLLQNLNALLSPTKLSVIQDNPGLQEMIQQISPKRRGKFIKRCMQQQGKAAENTNTTSFLETITWWSECPGRIAYNWQAEFRSWHIYEHPALQQYTTMLWLDTDAFCTKQWQQDPIHTLISNKLVLLFDNFPRGRAKGVHIQKRVHQAYNTTICRLQMNNSTGDWMTKLAIDGTTTNASSTASSMACKDRNFPIVHGFFHVTNLTFYRQNLHWSRALIGDCFLCRKYDDQIQVTVPPAILAPEKAWDMRLHGLNLGVYHNNHLDGSDLVGGFMQLWKQAGDIGSGVAGSTIGATSIVDPSFWRQTVKHCPVTAGG